MNLDKIIKSRKSVRNFTNKKPNWRDIIECIDVARYAPTAGNNYVLKFIIVQDKKKINDIAKASKQSFISQANCVVIAFSNPSRIINLYEEKGEIFFRQQAGAAIQNFLLKIEEKGLATCWVGYFDEEKIKKDLKIPEKMKLEAVFPIGYESEKTKLKNRIDLDRILHFNTYGTKKMKSQKFIET